MSFRVRVFTVFSAILFLVTGAFSAHAQTTTITGSDGQSIEIKDISRIISIGGAVTELLYAYGLDDKIVAIDTTSVFPERALKEKPNIGYMRQLSAEGILSLNPSLILAIDGAGPPDVIELLREASVPLVIVPNEPTAGGVIEKTKFVGNVVGADEQAEKLSIALKNDFANIKQVVQKIDEKRNLMFVLSLRGGRAMASGARTAAQGIMELAGAENAVVGFSGFKPLSDESIISAAPQTILMMEQRGGHGVSPDELFALPAFKATPSAEKRSLINIDGAYMLNFGPRTAQAARDLGKAIYPELIWPDLETSKEPSQ